MNDKIKHYQQIALEYAHNLNDIRFLGQVLFGVLILLVSWSGVKAIQTNYNLQKQISALQQQNDVQKLANDNLKLQNQYFNTNQYLELSARQNFSLAAPGEKEVLVPKTVALANTVNLGLAAKKDEAVSKQPAYQRNFQDWVDFFLHRQGTVD